MEDLVEPGPSKALVGNSLKVIEWDTELLQYGDYIKETNLLDQNIKDEICLAINEIISLYNQFNSKK